MNSPESRRRILFDTDLGADCDDAGTFAVMHALADRGEIDILAVGIVNGHENAVPCAHAINTWYGRPDLPIGTIKANEPFQMDEFLAPIVRDYPHRLTKSAAPDVVTLFRRILAAQPDRSGTLVAVGPPTNIAALLESGPDEHSDLSGVDLVRAKIAFYAAGGNGGGNLPGGRAGFNYQKDIKSAARELELLPTEFPTVFAGGSGAKVPVGNCFHQAAEDHIIRKCFEYYLKRKDDLDRPSWDQLRLLYAARPSWRDRFQLSPTGDITVDEERNIYWNPSPDRNRAYAYVHEQERAAVRAEIEALMMHIPDTGGH